MKIEGLKLLKTILTILHTFVSLNCTLILLDQSAEASQGVCEVSVLPYHIFIPIWTDFQNLDFL